MKGMRTTFRLARLVLAAAGVASLTACATTTEGVQSAPAVAPAPVPEPPPAPAVASVPAPAPELDPTVSRPRLSRTVTLGQQNEAPTYAGERPVAAREAGPSVVVNNQVVVNNGYGGYGYGYGGYGGYGYPRGGYGHGRGDGFAPRVQGSAPQWGQTGFEGARRTAAPGQTPAIGGNWSPPPSYGPASMR